MDNLPKTDLEKFGEAVDGLGAALYEAAFKPLEPLVDRIEQCLERLHNFAADLSSRK